jgi:hypothetical protein
MGALRTAARVVAVAGVLLAVLAVRVVSSSHAELRRGEHLERSGDIDGAILAYRRSARQYAPGNPYCARALDRLGRVAESAREAGDTEQALAAYRSMRGAILASRSVYVPHAARLRRAEAAIEELGAELAPPADRTEARARARAALSAPERPGVGWTLVLLLGWIGWTFGAFAFAQRALDEEDRLQSGPARLWGTVVVVGFGLFVIGMALA